MTSPGTYRWLLLLLLFLNGFNVFPQEPSTQGKEFFVSFFPNGGATTDPRMKVHLFITSSRNTFGSITNPATSYSQAFTVNANQVTIVTLPKTECLTLTDETVSNMVLKVTANDTISLFTLNEFPSSTDATVALPTEALGVKYRILSYGTGTLALVMATEDSTLVQIIPTANTLKGKPANTAFTVLLNRGQSYALQSTADLTGTLITSLSSCKKIAVYGGASCAEIPTGCGYCNHIYEQLLPVETWGQHFIFTPTKDRIFDVVRILANVPTNVTINGVNNSLAAGGYITLNCSTSTFMKIISDQPVAVAGYTTGQVCGGGLGDPSMFWVSPVEQMLKKVIFCATPFAGIDSNYVNLIVRTEDTSIVLLNGSVVHPFVVVASDNAYSAARILVNPGSNSIECAHGFLAYVYGYGSTNAYSYAAGSTSRATDRTIIVNGSKLAQGDSVYICGNAAAQMEVEYSHPIDHIKWLFGDGNNSDSLKVSHQYSGTGYLQLRAAVFRGGSCGSVADTLRAMIVLPSPLHIILPADTLSCYGSNVFRTANGTGGRPGTYSFLWNDLLTGQTRNIFVSSDTVIRVRLSDGCTESDSGQMKISVTLPPMVDAGVGGAVCSGDTITLSAAGKGGLGNYKYNWDHGAGNNDSVKVHPLQTTLYTVTVTDECLNTSTDTVSVQVKSGQGVSFTADSVQCFPGRVPFYILSPYEANSILSWDFGDQTFSSQKDPQHIYQAPGRYSVKLRIYSPVACDDSVTRNNMVTIHPKPKAFFIADPGTTTLEIPFIKFTNRSTGADKYLWDFGDHSSSQSFQPVHQFAETQTYNVILNAISSFGCRDTFEGKITIYPKLAFFVPSAFSPNSDLLNDLFVPGGEGILNYEITIFNRWGEVMFRSDNSNINWDGKLASGDFAPSDVYGYAIRVTDFLGNSYPYNGTVHLLR